MLGGKRTKKQIVAVAVAALLISAFAHQVFAYPDDISPSYTYNGEVVSIDLTHSLITLQAGPGDQSTFRLDDYATVNKCDMGGSFADLKAGEWASVSYFVENLGGRKIALVVDLAALGMKHC